jgi:hypothetical protein
VLGVDDEPPEEHAVQHATDNMSTARAATRRDQGFMSGDCIRTSTTRDLWAQHDRHDVGGTRRGVHVGSHEHLLSTMEQERRPGPRPII